MILESTGTRVALCNTCNTEKTKLLIFTAYAVGQPACEEFSIVKTHTHSEVIKNHSSNNNMVGCAVDTPVVNQALDVESWSEIEQKLP